MTLVELCEPLFQYVCRLNRSARKEASYGVNQVRGELQAIFAEIKQNAAADPKTAAQYKAVYPALVFFADFMIRNSNLDFASSWKDMAADIGESDGDERFFDMLDDVLRDPTPGATAQLCVFYTCLGLGFSGWYTGRTELLRKRMLEISARIRGVTEAEHASRIVPEAYEHLNTGNLIDPPGANLTGIGIALVGLLVVLFCANIYLYRSSSRSLSDSVQQIINSDASPSRSAPPQPPPPSTTPPLQVAPGGDGSLDRSKPAGARIGKEP
jgi:type IV/VI secretion system ImpK/VasF family protein